MAELEGEHSVDLVAPRGVGDEGGGASLFQGFGNPADDFKKAFHRVSAQTREPISHHPTITGKLAAGTNIAGAVLSINGLHDGIKNRDTVETALGAGNLVTNSASTALEISKIAGHSASPALEGAIGKANIVLMVADGAYQISKEDGAKHKVQRATAVAATTGLSLTLGTAAATTAETAALTSAVGTAGTALIVAAAPVVLTAAAVTAAAYTAEATIQSARAHENLDESRSGLVATRLHIESQLGAGPNAYQYKNLPAVIGDISRNMRDEQLGGRPERNADGRVKDPRQLNLNDPRTLAEYEHALGREIERQEIVLRENSSWVPRWLRGGEAAVKFEDAQTALKQLEAAREELMSYKAELKAYNQTRTKASNGTRSEVPRSGAAAQNTTEAINSGRDVVLEGRIRGHSIATEYNRVAGPETKPAAPQAVKVPPGRPGFTAPG